MPGGGVEPPLRPSGLLGWLEGVRFDDGPEVGVLVEVEALPLGLDELVGDCVDVVLVGVLAERAVISR